MKELPPKMNDPGVVVRRDGALGHGGTAPTKPQGIMRQPKYGKQAQRLNNNNNNNNSKNSSSAQSQQSQSQSTRSNPREKNQHQQQPQEHSRQPNRMDLTDGTSSMMSSDSEEDKMLPSSNSSSEYGDPKAASIPSHLGELDKSDGNSSHSSEHSFALEDLMGAENNDDNHNKNKQNEENQSTSRNHAVADEKKSADPHQEEEEEIERRVPSKSLSMNDSLGESAFKDAIVAQQQELLQRQSEGQAASSRAPPSSLKSSLKRSSSFSITEGKDMRDATRSMANPKKSSLKSDSNHSRDMEEGRHELQGILAGYYYNEHNCLVPREVTRDERRETPRERRRSLSRQRRESRRQNRRAGRRPSRGDPNDLSDASSHAQPRSYNAFGSFSSSDSDDRHDAHDNNDNAAPTPRALDGFESRGMTESEAAALASKRKPTGLTQRLYERAAAKTKQSQQSTRDRVEQEDDSKSNASFCFDTNNSVVGGDEDENDEDESIALEGQNDRGPQQEQSTRNSKLDEIGTSSSSTQESDRRRVGRTHSSSSRDSYSSQESVQMLELENSFARRPNSSLLSNAEESFKRRRRRRRGGRYDSSSSENESIADDSTMAASHSFKVRDYYGKSLDNATSDEESSLSASQHTDKMDDSDHQSLGVQAAFAATRNTSSIPAMTYLDTNKDDDSSLATSNMDDESFYSRGPQAAFAATREGVRRNVLDVVDISNMERQSSSEESSRGGRRVSTRDQTNDDMASYCFRKESESIIGGVDDEDESEASLDLNDLTGDSKADLGGGSKSEEPPSPQSVSSSSEVSEQPLPKSPLLHINGKGQSTSDPDSANDEHDDSYVSSSARSNGDLSKGDTPGLGQRRDTIPADSDSEKEVKLTERKQDTLPLPITSDLGEESSASGPKTALPVLQKAAEPRPDRLVSPAKQKEESSVPVRSASDDIVSGAANSGARELPARSSSAMAETSQKKPMGILRTSSFASPQVSRPSKPRKSQPASPLESLKEEEKTKPKVTAEKSHPRSPHQLQSKQQKSIRPDADGKKSPKSPRKAQQSSSPSRDTERKKTQSPAPRQAQSSILPVLSDTSESGIHSGNLFIEDESVSGGKGVDNSTPIGLSDDDGAGKGRTRTKGLYHDDDTLESDDIIAPRVALDETGRGSRRGKERPLVKPTRTSSADDISTVAADAKHNRQGTTSRSHDEPEGSQENNHDNSSQEWKFDLSAMEKVARKAEDDDAEISQSANDLQPENADDISATGGDEVNRAVEDSLKETEKLKDVIRTAERKVEIAQDQDDDYSAKKRARKEAKRARKEAKKEAKREKKERKAEKKAKDKRLHGSSGTFSASTLSNSGTLSGSAEDFSHSASDGYGGGGSRSSISLTPTAELNLPEEKRRIMEARRRERAARLEKAKERIRQKEENERRKKTEPRNTDVRRSTGTSRAVFANKPKPNADLTEEQRIEQAYSWYTRCGLPTKKKMKQLIRKIEGCRITEEDVDLLPWLGGGTIVNTSAVLKMTNKAYTG